MATRVLWLTSWYPSRVGPFDGDFIERHARAVSRFTKLTVLYIVKDQLLKNNAVEIEKTKEGNLSVYKVYYGKSVRGGWLEQFLSYRKYKQLQRQLYQQIVAENGYPAIVHVHVAMKAGLLALWIKKKYIIPFVVTEHWSGYNPQTHPNIYDGNALIRTFTKNILTQATMFLPVSDSLGNMVCKYLTTVRYKVVPNVVDTSSFNYTHSTLKRFRFIHPSSMIDIKNPEGILSACKMVKDLGYTFELLMIGGQSVSLVALADELGLSKELIFEGAVSYQEIAVRMQQSSALLMFSHFENLPCVVLEALCCGLPVVSSSVGGIPELIDEHNGILVESGDTAALAAAMMRLIDNYPLFDRKE
ncbi:MAG: glycosyltransferase, partial [Ferruginibacter sp.]